MITKAIDSDSSPTVRGAAHPGHDGRVLLHHGHQALRVRVGGRVGSPDERDFCLLGLYSFTEGPPGFARS